MRRDFITVEPDESLAEAREIMRLARLRHLLVARDRQLLGILSYRDLLEAQLGPDGALQPAPAPSRVETVMAPVPDCVTPDRSLAQAATRLWELRVGCLPVVEQTGEDTRLVGLITETDLLRAAYDRFHR